MNLLGQIKQLVSEANDVTYYETELLSEAKKRRKKPYHSFVTKHGHHIDVHVHHNKDGSGYAVYTNRHFGNEVRVQYWSHPDGMPSKHQMEGKKRKRKLYEEFLTEKTQPPKTIDSDAMGKITEHATARRLIHEAHENAGTVGTSAYHSELAPHHYAIGQLHRRAMDFATANGGDATAASIEASNREDHGLHAAKYIIEEIKRVHGEKAKIVRAGQTSKTGDIQRFTAKSSRSGKGVEEGQENPSDVMVAIRGSKLHNDPKYAEAKRGRDIFDGYSMKSLLSGTKTTASGPSNHFDGILDAPGNSWTNKVTEISQRTARSVVDQITSRFQGLTTPGGDHLGGEQRRKAIRAHPERNAIEAYGREVGSAQKKEAVQAFHDHINELAEAGHHSHIGRFGIRYLTNDTKIPWTKCLVRGGVRSKKSGRRNDIMVQLEPGSDSPLKSILSDKRTTFYSKLNPKGTTARLHLVHPETGEHLHFADIRFKPKSNAAFQSISPGALGANIGFGSDAKRLHISAADGVNGLDHD